MNIGYPKKTQTRVILMRSAWDSTSCRAPVVPTRSSRNLAVAKGGWMTMTESIETAMVTWASTIFGNLHLGGF